MILNPEPNLRPFSTSSRPRDEEGHPAIAPALRDPISDSCPPPAPVPRLPEPDTPRVTTRTTTAVPVRSKQRSNNPDDPQPKKKQRSEDIMVNSVSSRPISLPTSEEVPPDGFNSDDSDQEVVSRVYSVHNTSAVEAGPMTISSTIPRLIAQFHQLQELQLQSPFQKVLHPTLPFEFFNPQNLIGAPLIRLSDLGQALKTMPRIDPSQK